MCVNDVDAPQNEIFCEDFFSMATFGMGEMQFSMEQRRRGIASTVEKIIIMNLFQACDFTKIHFCTEGIYVQLIEILNQKFNRCNVTIWDNLKLNLSRGGLKMQISGLKYVRLSIFAMADVLCRRTAQIIQISGVHSFDHEKDWFQFSIW